MYNKNFNLNIKDLELIETAIDCKINSLLSLKHDKSAKEQIIQLHELKGKLHNQKTWYRPKKGVYISG